ncbi:MAG: CHC2 zinc finger domain-containing protein [Thermomicrobiales bacterium]
MNGFHGYTENELLAFVESRQWLIADADENPNEWDYPEQSKAVLLIGLEDALKELRRRKRLRRSPYAPLWVDQKAELDEIKRRVDLPRFFEHHAQITLRRSGRTRYRGKCPFHDDGTPSLSIDAEKGLWCCFGCGRGGDVFTFAQEIMGGCSFGDAVDLVARDIGLERKARPAPRLTFAEVRVG